MGRGRDVLQARNNYRFILEKSKSGTQGLQINGMTMENDNRKYEYLHNYVHTQGSKSGITLEGSSQFTSTVVGYLVIPEIEISK